MAKPKVFVTRRWPAAVEECLGDRFDVTLNNTDHPLDSDRLRSALADYDAVLPTVTDRLDSAVLGVRPMRTRLLANFGVGFNHIDLDAARSAGLAISNTPSVLTDCTADLTLTLLLMVARRAGEGERQLRAGTWAGWSPTHLLGTRITGKTLGLIGLGRIGRAVAKRACAGFGMQTLFFNPSPIPDEVCSSLGATPCRSIEEVLSRSDFVSLHCPASPSNRHLIDASALGLMQPTAFLINTARGDVIDTEALIAALEQRRIAGAGLDVYEDEPAIDPRLLALENVVLLPHLGSATEATRTDMGMRVIENVTAFFAGSPLPDRVI